MYYQMKTKQFLDEDFHQEINKKKIIDALKNIYKNKAFSTFPYIIKNYNSKSSIEKFNSGNCIALSMYLKKYLMNKYNIKSYLIPATIPRRFSHRDYLNLSHVSLAIPKNNNTIYIADPAFYFLNPIKIRLNSSKNSRIFSKNIYLDEVNDHPKDYTSIDRIICKTERLSEDLILNKYQRLPKNIIYSKCYYCKDKDDIWNYYLIEILNPDKSISNFFSNIRFEPFIMTTKLDKNGVCVSEFYIKVEFDSIVIKKNNNVVERLYFGQILQDPNYFKSKIEKYNLSKFFDDDLINGIFDYINDVQSYKKNINISD